MVHLITSKLLKFSHLSRTIQQLTSFDFSSSAKFPRAIGTILLVQIRSLFCSLVDLTQTVGLASFSVTLWNSANCKSLLRTANSNSHTFDSNCSDLLRCSCSCCCSFAICAWAGSPLPPTHFALEPCMLCVFVERPYDGKRLNMHRVATTPMQNSGAAQTIPDSSTCLSATLAFQLRYNWSWSVQCL